MDPNNPIVQLCAEGMQAEGEARPEDAATLFGQAWEAATNDFERAIAAHYVARHQATPEETLYWNRVAVECAQNVSRNVEENAHLDKNNVRDFYPSLYLNLAHSYEQMKNIPKAEHYYDIAAESLTALPAGPYTDLVRRGIDAGQKRVSGEGSQGLE